MIATSYLATLLSFRRPQDCGYQRVAGAQIVYGSIVSGTSISRIDGFFKAPSHAVLQVGTVKAPQTANFSSPSSCPQLRLFRVHCFTFSNSFPQAVWVAAP